MLDKRYCRKEWCTCGSEGVIHREHAGAQHHKPCCGHRYGQLGRLAQEALQAVQYCRQPLQRYPSLSSIQHKPVCCLVALQRLNTWHQACPASTVGAS